MKILIDARFYGLENTGLGRYTINLLENLQEIDKSNEYFILLRSKYYKSLNFNKNFKKVLADFGHYSFSEQIIIPFFWSKYRPDISHFLHFNTPLLYPGKFIATLHDLLMHRQKGKDATTLSYPIYLIKRLAYHLAFLNSVIRSNKIIVPSEFVKKDLLSHYRFVNSSKIFAIYEGISLAKSIENSDSVLKKYNLKSKNYFIYVGNTYPHKNIKRAVEAIKLLNKESKEKVYFVIVCARNYFVKKLMNEISSSYVKIIDFAPDNELSVLYKESIAFLYPSLHEGFGLPGLEAQKAGTLSVVSDIEIFREIYKNSVIYFDPMDPTDIKNKLKKVQLMPNSQRQDFNKKATQLHKNYSWQKMSHEIEKLYLE